MGEDASETPREGEGTRARLGGVVETVKETVSSTLGRVNDKLPRPDDVRNVARRGAGVAEENPLGLALGALAVGLLAGLAAPVTEFERRTVGPIRDDVVARAKTAGSDAIERGKHALQERAEAALGGVGRQQQSGGP